MPQHSPIDHTSIALGEMREFMTHHRRQMDEVQSSISELSDAQKRLQHNHDAQTSTLDETRKDVGEIKTSLDALCRYHNDKKLSRKWLWKGVGAGLILGVLFAAVYYGDMEMVKLIYRYTIGGLSE